LVALFSDPKCTERAIDNYVESQGKDFKLPNFISSYIAAWHRKSNPDEKDRLLHKHIPTVQKYIPYRKVSLDVLFGIQIFFYNEDVKENKNEMMTFLLQFFSRSLLY